MKEKLINRLVSYAKINTQANPNKETVPTTEGQLILANELVTELQEIGLSDVEIDKNGYVLATLKANTDQDIPTIGFLAHLDTATEVTGEHVKPHVIENFNGTSVELHAEK